MSLLVDSDIFSWLQTHKLVATGTVLPNGKVELPRDIANRFFDGMLVCAVCRLLLTERGEEETAQTLEAIKENVTPAMRVYNWNILTDALLKLKYSLDYS